MAAAPRGPWLSLHCFPRTTPGGTDASGNVLPKVVPDTFPGTFPNALPDTLLDAFLVEDLAPLLDGLVAGGEAAAWFFVRHEEGGPHLRVRVRSPRPAVAAELGPTLRRLTGARQAEGGGAGGAVGTVAAVEVREVPYVPDPGGDGGDGGPLAPAVAEEVSVRSTRVAVDAVAGAARGSRRLAVAADLAHATAWALGMDRFEAARWLRGQAAGRPWAGEAAPLPARLVHTQVNTVYAAQRESLCGRAVTLRAELADGTARGPVARWAAAVRAADTAPEPGADGGADPAGGGTDAAGGGGGADGADGADDADGSGREAAWAAQLRLLFNRLGVAPAEARAVYRLCARALLDSGEPASYFPDGHLAPDRQYLERSKFQVGRDIDALPRYAPPERASGAAEVALPGGPLPDVPLRAAVTGRTSVRGALTGPLTATGLGTLLWGAHATSHTTGSGDALAPHRPYPSAGALYTAGLRLFAFGVEGLAPGAYQCVPERRSLRRLGDAPALDEVRALSAYLSRPAGDPLAVVVDDVPVVLGLYVDFGRLRRRYGLRALRLGLLEAGHLAQSLLLTASALGLATTPLGGFRDDLAQELFGLDDMDQPLQYLLPLGRAPLPVAVPVPVPVPVPFPGDPLDGVERVGGRA
ncbi:SagB family peptide dehydrogenase [Streptomyces sp. NPDC051567]|uniref:SagB family peptide dehydrogenase n=1 Tax=Streptomyces sp. NPDC051567 TaxID=3365660 RepID=UPI003791CEE2